MLIEILIFPSLDTIDKTVSLSYFVEGLGFLLQIISSVYNINICYIFWRFFANQIQGAVTWGSTEIFKRMIISFEVF